MPEATFRFFADLNDFLPPQRRGLPFAHPIRPGGSIKDAIEAIGVPHPEIRLITVNGTSVGFDHSLTGGERIAVYPQFASFDIQSLSRVLPPPLPRIGFVLDVHLGRLARWLRLLGFDTLYRNDFSDGELARLSAQENRILLTQDRGLLKRRRIEHGAMVRSSDPEAQLKEVLERYGLHQELRPFVRCPRCNGPLVPVAKESIAHRLPRFTREEQEHFRECRSCRQLYWRGAHRPRLDALIEGVRRLSPAPPPDRESPGGDDGEGCRSAPGRSPPGPHR
ncbi:MAG: Mut7-C RNAse domain-containing protein [Synechococcaceae cyanobacterium]|nr:Mut7-C RNAse domain-containing protein [Synechococcaceae cyanobacterium]